MSCTKPFRKLSECTGCLYYASDPYLLCAVHPYGVQGEVCSAFREDPSWSQFLSLDWVMAVDESDVASVYGQSGEETQSSAEPKERCDHAGE